MVSVVAPVPANAMHSSPSGPASLALVLVKAPDKAAHDLVAVEAPKSFGAPFLSFQGFLAVSSICRAKVPLTHIWVSLIGSTDWRLWLANDFFDAAFVVSDNAKTLPKPFALQDVDGILWRHVRPNQITAGCNRRQCCDLGRNSPGLCPLLPQFAPLSALLPVLGNAFSS